MLLFLSFPPQALLAGVLGLVFENPIEAFDCDHTRFDKPESGPPNARPQRPSIPRHPPHLNHTYHPSADSHRRRDAKNTVHCSPVSLYPHSSPRLHQVTICGRMCQIAFLTGPWWLNPMQGQWNSGNLGGRLATGLSSSSEAVAGPYRTLFELLALFELLNAWILFGSMPGLGDVLRRGVAMPLNGPGRRLQVRERIPEGARWWVDLGIFIPRQIACRVTLPMELILGTNRHHHPES